MYQQHFGFTDAPFRLTPDTDYFYAYPSHQEALNLLKVALMMGEGFIKITGEVGSGKSLLCRKLMHTLGEDYYLAYIPNPFMNASALRQVFARELGIESPPSAQHQLMQVIQERLIELATAGKKVVLLLDEAQALPLQSLEAIRLFTNLETEKRKLLQVVLFGQPELDENLAIHSVRQVRQRITFSFHLQSMDLDGMAGYIKHRLNVAGAVQYALFQPAAVRKLYRSTKGIPRLVNILAHKSLMAAYGKGDKFVTPAHVADAIKDTSESVGKVKGGFWLRFAGVSVSTLAATGVMYMFGLGA